MTLANIITLTRLGLIPLLIAELLMAQWELTLGLLAVILAGDLADGALARWRKEITALGKMLDPLVDKLLFASLLAALAWQGRLPWLVFGLLAFQQLALLCGALALRMQEAPVPAARLSGKSASAILSLGVAVVLWGGGLEFFGLGLLYFGVGLSYLAAVDYALQIRVNLRGPRAPSRTVE
jgi:phosphatidylglycerophosphate synthase